MNDDFDKIFDAIQSEVAWLHARWISYETLYGKSEIRIDLLNSSAQSFFYHLQFILLDDIELFICKLLDPATQRDKKNLTLEQLLHLLEKDNTLKNELESILSDLNVKSSNIRKRRNKRLGHFDLNSSIDRPVELFSKSSRKEINEILKLIRNYLNLIQTKYRRSTLAYDKFSSKGDTESLISCLKRSESYKFLEKQAIFEHGFWRTKGPFFNA